MEIVGATRLPIIELLPGFPVIRYSLLMWSVSAPTWVRSLLHLWGRYFLYQKTAIGENFFVKTYYKPVSTPRGGPHGRPNSRSRSSMAFSKVSPRPQP